jgi:AbrB family looped-hinge helix DNA binding protein
LRIAEGGRIVIPAAVREMLGMSVGSEVILTVEADQATLVNATTARRRAQERVRKYIAPGTKLSEELMADRKKEFARE